MALDAVAAVGAWAVDADGVRRAVVASGTSGRLAFIDVCGWRKSQNGQ